VGGALLADALGHVPAGELVFAAVAPGNARSLRAFLGLGFSPLGCELVLERRGSAEREP
jgi:RimJ/RimL family protein N-acetyltransferase